MVLDTCAAPGGKTAVLAERLPQSTILAVDASRRRLDALRAAMEPDHRTLRFQAADAARLRLVPIYGLILCDVPCTGTGTIARNPEIRLRIEAADLPRQHARQIAILRAALQGLAPEGRLVYSTCSLESEENDAVVEEILRAFPNLRVVPIGPILDQLTTEGIVTAEGRERLSTALQGESLRTLPGIHPCDGFFAAVLARD
jgi:16S rRNA (cytosine967-C5)-methyltransferase